MRLGTDPRLNTMGGIAVLDAHRLLITGEESVFILTH